MYLISRLEKIISRVFNFAIIGLWKFWRVFNSQGWEGGTRVECWRVCAKRISGTHP